MPSTWTIKANDKSYGPYTLEQMRTFAGEGRLASHSFVARDGEMTYGPAGDDLVLAGLFRPQAQAPVQRPVFFTAEGDIGRTREEPQTSPISRFIIIADMKSRSIAGVEEEIHRLGHATALMPQAWLLTSELTLNALRNNLIQRLGRIDMLFIVDASHNKAAWFNFGPEADSRIRRIWQLAHETQAA